MKESEIEFTDIETIKSKSFDTITIYPRRKKHRYSNHNCMYFCATEIKTGQEYWFKGEETDVIKIENIECSMDIVNSNKIRLYHKIGSPNREFKIVHCMDTLVIQ